METVHKFDLVLVFVSLATLIFLVGYSQPLVVAPLDDYETSETEVLFEIEKAEKLLIDDNIDFTTPVEYDVREGLKIELEPGKYYWKAVGVLGSKIRTLTIQSTVSLELKKLDGDGLYGVVNKGNVRLNVHVFQV